ncbi:MAG: excinuclease ABC subunit UvrC [Sedimentisphaerales bacterium]|nr:excinuclease ABC subunit UvrC [Sedimentisphaerales bacterium]
MQSRLERIRQQIREFPTGPGLYVMKDADDHVLYIGKAKNLRSRVASYFQPGADLASSRGPKIVEMVSRVYQVDYIPCDNEVEAILKEARLIKDIRPPYNTDLVDDKTFPYLEITTSDEFPAVYVTRKPRPQGSRLFGPFPNVSDLRAAVQLLQRIYRFRTCTLEISESDPKRRFFRPCLLYSIKQCTAPCAARIDKAEYRKSITDLIRFLRSKRSTVLRQLYKQMSQAAARLEYEKAAMYRDRIRLIERLGERGIPDLHVQPEVFASDPTEALSRLREVLKLEGQIRIIEGIDVAHIAGSQAVGALVKFIDGRPFKAGYRRFKIKTVEGIDDYAMISEVVKRRYRHCLEGEEPWPDLILIDGGIGQLNAAQDALSLVISQPSPSQVGPLPVIVSLAKQEELIYRQGWPIPLDLPRHDPALRLLQYIRDEAHRFAQHYHHLLRSKTITEQG